MSSTSGQESHAASVPISYERAQPSTKKSIKLKGPSFRTLASDRSGSDKAETIRIRLRDAFMPSQPVLGREMLAGRIDLLSQLIQAVEDQRSHVVVYGQRGIGKTSLLRVFAEIAREAGYLVLHETCGATTQFGDLFRNAAAQIPLRYHASLAPTDEQSELGGGLADLLPESGSGPNRVSHILAQVTGTRVIIVLDEFDRVVDSHFQRDVAELLKNISDSSARVQIVIAGVAENLQELMVCAPSVRRSVIGIPVGRLSNAEVADIITIGEKHADVRFALPAATRIVEISQGLPHLARVLCHHASLHALSEGRTAIELGDVHPALVQALAEMEASLPSRTRAAAKRWVTSHEALTGALASAALEGDGSFDIDDVRGKSLETNPASLTIFLDQLSASGMLLTMPSASGTISYSFAEDSLPLYLMLNSTVRNVPTGDRKGRA